MLVDLFVPGHLLSTAEVESALVEHEAVAEAAVVGRPHPVKGESLYCFVTLNDGINYNQKLEAGLKKQGMCASVNGSCKNVNSVIIYSLLYKSEPI